MVAPRPRFIGSPGSLGAQPGGLALEALPGWGLPVALAVMVLGGGVAQAWRRPVPAE